MNKILIAAGFAAILGLGLAATCAEQSHRETHVVTIDSKERQCDASTDSDGKVEMHCYYVVFGTNGEVFRNEDAVLLFGGPTRAKFDSATMQARLHIGDTYRITTIGWRVPWASMKPNIINAEKVS